MKRGRPSKRADVRKAILDNLERVGAPLTASALSRIVSEETGSKLSWNTVQKYTRELVDSGRVQPIVLQHSKKPGEPGLTVYVLKK
jgi:hypothetical protein